MAWRTEADQTNCRMNNGMGKLCSEWRSSCFLWGFGTEVPLIKIASVCVCMRTEMETGRARTDRRISLQSPWNPDCFAHPNVTRKKYVTSLCLKRDCCAFTALGRRVLTAPEELVSRLVVGIQLQPLWVFILLVGFWGGPGPSWRYTWDSQGVLQMSVQGTCDKKTTSFLGGRGDIYLFIWQCWVLIAACGLFVMACEI